MFFWVQRFTLALQVTKNKTQRSNFSKWPKFPRINAFKRRNFFFENAMSKNLKKKKKIFYFSKQNISKRYVVIQRIFRLTEKLIRPPSPLLLIKVAPSRKKPRNFYFFKLCNLVPALSISHASIFFFFLNTLFNMGHFIFKRGDNGLTSCTPIRFDYFFFLFKFKLKRG